MALKITQEELKARLNYNPDTGIFTWKANTRGRKFNGTVAGGYDSDGYVVICINYISYKAHQLAYLYMTGDWIDQVDHKDTVKYNNKWDNLRPASNSGNGHNKGLLTTNTSGVKGVSYHRGRWKIRVELNGVRYNGGSFVTLEAAAQAVKELRESLVGEFTRHE